METNSGDIPFALQLANIKTLIVLAPGVDGKGSWAAKEDKNVESAQQGYKLNKRNQYLQWKTYVPGCCNLCETPAAKVIWQGIKRERPFLEKEKKDSRIKIEPGLIGPREGPSGCRVLLCRSCYMRYGARLMVAKFPPISKDRAQKCRCTWNGEELKLCPFHEKFSHVLPGECIHHGEGSLLDPPSQISDIPITTKDIHVSGAAESELDTLILTCFPDFNPFRLNKYMARKGTELISIGHSKSRSLIVDCYEKYDITMTVKDILKAMIENREKLREETPPPPFSKGFSKDYENDWFTECSKPEVVINEMLTVYLKVQEAQGLSSKERNATRGGKISRSVNGKPYKWVKITISMNLTPKGAIKSMTTWFTSEQPDSAGGECGRDKSMCEVKVLESWSVMQDGLLLKPGKNKTQVQMIKSENVVSLQDASDTRKTNISKAWFTVDETGSAVGEGGRDKSMCRVKRLENLSVMQDGLLLKPGKNKTQDLIIKHENVASLENASDTRKTNMSKAWFTVDETGSAVGEGGRDKSMCRVKRLENLSVTQEGLLLKPGKNKTQDLIIKHENVSSLENASDKRKNERSKGQQTFPSYKRQKRLQLYDAYGSRWQDEDLMEPYNWTEIVWARPGHTPKHSPFSIWDSHKLTMVEARSVLKTAMTPKVANKPRNLEEIKISIYRYDLDLWAKLEVMSSDSKKHGRLIAILLSEKYYLEPLPCQGMTQRGDTFERWTHKGGCHPNVGFQLPKHLQLGKRKEIGGRPGFGQEFPPFRAEAKWHSEEHYFGVDPGHDSHLPDRGWADREMRVPVAIPWHRENHVKRRRLNDHITFNPEPNCLYACSDYA